MLNFACIDKITKFFRRSITLIIDWYVAYCTSRVGNIKNVLMFSIIFNVIQHSLIITYYEYKDMVNHNRILENIDWQIDQSCNSQVTVNHDIILCIENNLTPNLNIMRCNWLTVRKSIKIFSCISNHISINWLLQNHIQSSMSVFLCLYLCV